MLTQGFLNDLLTSGATDLVGRLQVTSCPSITPTSRFSPKQKNHEPRPTRAGYLIETGAVPQRPLPVDAVGWEPVYDWDVGNPAQQREWCIPNVTPNPAPDLTSFPSFP